MFFIFDESRQILNILRQELPGDHEGGDPDGHDAGAGAHFGAGVRRPQGPANGVVPLDAYHQDGQHGGVADRPFHKWNHLTCSKREIFYINIMKI